MAAKLQRSISKRRLDQNEAATSAVLSHQVTVREQRAQQQQLKEIVDELTKNPQKVAKAHAMVCLSNVCEPDRPGGELEKELWFSGNYRKLERIPKTFLQDEFLPSLLPDTLAPDALGLILKKDPEALMKLFMLACCEAPKSPFGPKKQSTWKAMYLKRAKERGNMLKQIQVQDDVVMFEKCGLYSLCSESLGDGTSSQSAASFTHIRIGDIMAPLGQFSQIITAEWIIMKNYSFDQAYLMPSGGASLTFPCKAFFDSVPAFHDYVTPTAAQYDGDCEPAGDDVVAAPKKRAKAAASSQAEAGLVMSTNPKAKAESVAPPVLPKQAPPPAGLPARSAKDLASQLK